MRGYLYRMGTRLTDFGNRARRKKRWYAWIALRAGFALRDFALAL